MVDKHYDKKLEIKEKAIKEWKDPIVEIEKFMKTISNNTK